MDDPKDDNGIKQVPDSSGKGIFLPFSMSFFITFGFWLLFSGRFDGFHIGIGGLSCLIVSIPGHRLLFPGGLKPGFIFCWARFAVYLPWLFKEIFLANLHLLYLTFHPRMGELIHPRIIEFDSRLKSDIARTTFANSITLTPGTITVHAGIMGSFAVHCIDTQSGENLPGTMEEKIMEVFKEP